ncbi:hypothetical protein TNCV_2897871 [Trichonephila clavipes]|nr:hypothetical protein TNCV_2897871 [Trichonephila clavipes]
MIHFSARLHSTFANHLIDLQSYVTLLSGGTLNSRRPISPHTKLGNKKSRYHLQGVVPQNGARNVPNRAVTCMVLKGTANDGHASSTLPQGISWAPILQSRSNSQDVQLAISNDPKKSRLELNLGFRQAKKGKYHCRDSLATPLS